jgi:hypothetical protein
VLEELMKLYVMSMAYDVRSPMPHIVGPAGCGKSSSVEALASLLGKELHIVNVSRLSPLDVEGVQMPHGSGDDMVLRMLPATFWTSLKEGDVLLMDEFLRGFPEVYNALLDIFTSRRVGAFRLPKVFIVGASNSVVAYDQALEDRLLHIPVRDPRKSASEQRRIAKMIVRMLGLHPDIVSDSTMFDLVGTYDILDSFKKKGTKASAAPTTGTSVRNLVGQVQMRRVDSLRMREVLDASNGIAYSKGAYQYIVLYRPACLKSMPRYPELSKKLLAADLDPLHRLNTMMNRELMGLWRERARPDEEEEDL